MLHVFTGPTIGHDEIDETVTTPRDVTLWPPIRHGDLIRRKVAAGDRVLIVDGLFHQSMAIRHREILDALANDVSVYGCSSMGALRAAELAPFGMVPLGSIALRYTDARLERDADVAVAQGPDDRPLSIAVVNIEHAASVFNATVPAVDVERVLSIARQIFYPLRTRQRLEHELRRDPSVDEFATWYAESLSADRRALDLKYHEAKSAIELLFKQPDRRMRPRGIARHVPTTHEARWNETFVEATVDGDAVTAAMRVDAQRIFNPSFADAMRTHFGRLRTGCRCAGEPAAWRAHVNAHDVEPDRIRQLVDSHETTWARKLVVEAHRLNLATAKGAHPEQKLRTMRPSVVREFLCDVWDVDEACLEGAAIDRHFYSVGEALRAARRFVLAYKRGLVRDTAATA